MVPDFFPFPGLRYQREALGTGLEELTAPPYDVIDTEARARLEAAHPLNIVHIILPRDSAPGDRYSRAATRFSQWQTDGVLAPDPPSFYLYRMAYADEDGAPRATSGVVGALALSLPGEGAVLPHERTMPKPRGDRLSLLREVEANLDPVWCLSLAGGLTDLLRPAGPAVAECVDEDGVEHCLFLLDPAVEAAVAAAVGSAPVVIADGHHRYETALAYADEDPGANAIMALVVELSQSELGVKAIHRLLGGVGSELRGRLAACATLTPRGANTPEATRDLVRVMDTEGAMGFVDGDGLALLSLRDDVLGSVLARLPVSLEAVDSARLEVALEWAGSPESVGVHHDPLVGAGAVAKGAADAAVLLRPVTIPQIEAVAAAGERMPEKTTFFAPKPRTGMVFRKF